MDRDRSTSGTSALAVVTGASSGIGEATARELRRRGYHVLAGVRRSEDADRLRAEGLEPVQLDVTDDAQIASLVDRVTADPAQRPLHILVNNAGVALAGPAEAIPLDAWRAHFEVNFFGQIAVTQALLPALIGAAGSRLVNVTSIGGRVAGPTFGAYASAKFALEAFSDVLRREVGRLGVTVIVVEPGVVATRIWGKGGAAIHDLSAGLTREQHERYDDLLRGAESRARELDRSNAGLPPQAVATVIADAVQAKRPRTRYLVGRDAKLMATMGRYLGDRVADRVMARALRSRSST